MSIASQQRFRGFDDFSASDETFSFKDTVCFGSIGSDVLQPIAGQAAKPDAILVDMLDAAARLARMPMPSAVADDYRDSVSDTTAPFGSLAPGGSVTGSLEVGGDRDVFAISLVAGQRYTFNLQSAASGGTPDTVLRLLNGSGGQIAVNDDFGGSLNSQITYTATASGTFYLEARDYSSSGRGAYRLSSTGTPTTPADDFRDSLTDTTAAFGQLGAGTSATGRIETGGDTDVFAITLTAGQTYTINLAGSSSGGLSNPALRLLNGSGTQLAANDDFNGGVNSQITFAATTSGTFYLEARGQSATLTGGYTLGATAAATNPPPGGAFDIQINYTGDAQYRAAFEQAAARWEQAIIADVPDFTSRTYGFIDDLLIDARAVAIDGRGGVLGRAGPDEVRSGSLIPTHGTMEFDSADLAQLAANGTLVGVIMHEMGHVLGLGTLWDSKGLKSDTFSYIGTNALREYRTLSGNAGATSVPLETTGGQGTAGAHWSEAIFGTELMTGFANGALQMSRMTIGGLADLGYGVNYAAADAYVLPGRASAVQQESFAGDIMRFEAVTDEIFGIL